MNYFVRPQSNRSARPMPAPPRWLSVYNSNANSGVNKNFRYARTRTSRTPNWRQEDEHIDLSFPAAPRRTLALLNTSMALDNCGRLKKVPGHMTLSVARSCCSIRCEAHPGRQCGCHVAVVFPEVSQSRAPAAPTTTAARLPLATPPAESDCCWSGRIDRRP